ncbi:MAG: hypothetical protein ACW99Q_28100, partial [Candidatus Kariarchaeaceae archaeon]
MIKRIDPKGLNLSTNNFNLWRPKLNKFTKRKSRMFLVVFFYIILISPSLIAGDIHDSRDHSKIEEPSIQNIDIQRLNIREGENDPSSKIVIIDRSQDSQNDESLENLDIKPLSLPNDDLDQNTDILLDQLGYVARTPAPMSLPIQTTALLPTPGCVNPTSDFLIVDHGQIKSHIFANNFTYQTVTEEGFAALTVEDILQYRMVLMEPN